MLRSTLTTLRPALALTLILMVITGIAYPLAITGVAQVLFPHQANGSLMKDAQGQTIGSALIGQGFTATNYFWGRPSVAGANGYDATSSGGSNLGPTSKKLHDEVAARATALRQASGLPADAVVPAELVTASASGLDPDISPSAANFQVARVAKARGLPEATLYALISRQTTGRTLGFLGEPRVNVLKLNEALDALKQQ
jgi:potassium-transporting ATPase KdpC subunit